MSPLPPSVLERWETLSARERRLVFAGVAAVLLFLLYLLLRGAGGNEGDVELTAAPPATASASVPPAPAPIPAAPPPPAPAAAPAASPDGLMLYGVALGGTDGGAAIIGPQGGKQRLVRLGRIVIPGVTLKEVGDRHVLLATANGEMRLNLVQPATAGVAAAAQ